MAARRSRYRSLDSLQRDNRRCRACADAGFPLESRPVFEGRSGQRRICSARRPAPVEGVELRPWRGRAGQTLRRWLGLDEDDVLRDVLLRVGDALRPGPRAVRPRRPHADAGRAATLRVLAGPRTRTAAPAARGHGRRTRAATTARADEPDRRDRRDVRTRRRRRGAAAASVRGERLARTSRRTGRASRWRSGSCVTSSAA